MTLTGSPVVGTNLALDSTQTLTSVVTEIKCARCNPTTTEDSSETGPTVSETTTKEPTDPVTSTEKSTVSGTPGGKSTVSVTTTEQPTTLVAPTEEPSCSSFPTDPTTDPIPIPTEVPSCSAGPTEPTTGPIPVPTEKSTASGTTTGKTTVSSSDTDTSCSAVPVPTKKPTQPPVGEHSGVPPTSTHIEITIPITPGEGGPNTLSTRITLATSKGGSNVPTPSQLSTPLRSTGGAAAGGLTTATSQHSQGSGAGTQVTKHTGEATRVTTSPSPTYNGGTSLKKMMCSPSLAAGILLAYFISSL